MTEPSNRIQTADALVLVDVQRDFCPGGLLPIDKGDQIIAVLNEWIEIAQGKGVSIYASQDWHPRQHISFRDQGGKWPPHCIQDSDGAQFHPDLKLPVEVVKITKGVRFDQDQSSVFDQTGFAEELKRNGVKRLWVGGLALDVCVLASVLDALKYGFVVMVLKEASRPVDVESGKTAIAKMKAEGATIVV
jgi:nicotinamidase/pyrazinamidase